MSLILDTGPVIALADRNDPYQPRIRSLLRKEPGVLVIPAPVSAEIDYLLGQRLGERARLAYLEDLAQRRFDVACLEPPDYRLVYSYETRYADLGGVGLADLSVVMLAFRFGTRRVLTFDQRHFRALRAVDGKPFVLLPFDE